MASIARSLRVAAPMARAFAPRATSLARPAFRTFSTTKLNPIRMFTKEHEWIDINEQTKTGFVGITEYAAEQLGDVVYVELPQKGQTFDQGDAFGAVESVKSASDLNAPVSFTIEAVNSALEEKPSTINKVPEDDSPSGGWVAKVTVDAEGLKQLETLMDAEAYNAHVGSEH